MTTRTYTRDGLAAILAAHRLWLRGEPGGVRANLSRADLRGADLSGAHLGRANLSGADLSVADLSGASLRWTTLNSADLSGANLGGADLGWTLLSGTDLRGAVGLPDAPIIPDIHRAILAACTADGAGLDMSRFHTCATTHGRAGWAIHLAGAAGYALEERYGPEVAGALIYHASDPMIRTPKFLSANAVAMADMRRLAGVE